MVFIQFVQSYNKLFKMGTKKNDLITPHTEFGFPGLKEGEIVGVFC